MGVIVTNPSFSIGIALTLFATYLIPFSYIQADRNDGFSLELIHRNSPISPLYNPFETPSQRVTNAVQRSLNRVNLLKPASFLSNVPKSTITVDVGEYLMKISIGTPPVEILGVADTGSDLTWTQCMPCINCYKQKAPIFDPKNSKTYTEIPRNSSECQSVNGTSSLPHTEDICHYRVSYRDGSYSKGVLATETVTFGSTAGQPVSFPKTLFGCGQDNEGLFSKNGSGMIGLGRGSMSLISQMSSSIDGKFSYCLVQPFSGLNSSSKMSFGSESVLSGPKVISTRLLSGSDRKSLYGLRLEAMSVGHKRLQYNSSLSSPLASAKGNIIIDSGTTLTLLPNDFYNKLELTVSKAIRLKRVSGQRRFLSLCYRTKSAIKAPIITVHFTGADVKLTALNTFVRLSMDVVCFAFRPISREVGVFGNMAQSNLLIGYDLKKKTVSFKPTDCTKY